MAGEVQPFFKNSYVTLSASEESQQLIWRFCPRYQDRLTPLRSVVNDL